MSKQLILIFVVAILCHPSMAAEIPAQQQASVEELEQRCEEMRENRIRPLRAAEIEKCIQDETKDPAWCRSQYQDYGNTPPRMFDDLLPCEQAREMQAKTREGTVASTKRGETTTDVDKTIKELTTTPEEGVMASQGKVKPISQDSTLGTDKRDTEKVGSTRDSTLPDNKRDSTSGTSTR